MPVYGASGYGPAMHTTPSQRPAARSAKKAPWGAIIAIACGLLVIGMAVTGGISLMRMVKRNMPRTAARTSQLPPEAIERYWNQQNKGPVTWESMPLSGGYTMEWPSAKAVPFPRNGFDSLTLTNGRALGPEGPYFSVKVSSAGLLSKLHGKPGESSQDVLALAIQRRQSLPQSALVGSSDFQMDGNPGKNMTFRETIDGKPVLIHVRMLVTRQNIYALWVGGLESSLKDEDIRRFLDSFRLKSS
jgi:hypothetical protein